MEPSSFLCFVHIEKAGGITLHNLFHRLYFGYVSPHPNKLWGNPWTPAHIEALKRISPSRVTGVGGHRIRAYFDYEKAIGRKAFYFTMMRDPVSLYLSHLNWQIHLKQKYPTVESFFEGTYSNNFQAYRIAGEKNLDKAKEIMAKNFNLIGMVERYDEAMVLLRSALGNPNADFRYEQANIREYGDKKIRFEDLSSDLQAKVFENNAIDIELYRFLKEELYPQFIRNYPGNLAADLEAYQRANQGYHYPLWALTKRKLSNALMTKVIQPRMFRDMQQRGEI